MQKRTKWNVIFTIVSSVNFSTCIHLKRVLIGHQKFQYFSKTKDIQKNPLFESIALYFRRECSNYHFDRPVYTISTTRKKWYPYFVGERGGSVVECRTPEREVRGSRPTAAMLCP